jgi:predicted kinase
MTGKIIAIGGLPLAGKTTLGRLLSKEIGIHCIDVDEGPALCAQPASDNPYSSVEKTRIENDRMDVLYAVMHTAVAEHVRLGLSLIISATYRNAVYRQQLLNIVQPADFKFLLCRSNNSVAEITRRVDMRLDSGAIGGCRSVEQYFKLLPLWRDPEFDHCVVDTTQGLQFAFSQALKYVS